MKNENTLNNNELTNLLNIINDRKEEKGETIMKTLKEIKEEIENVNTRTPYTDEPYYELMRIAQENQLSIECVDEYYTEDQVMDYIKDELNYGEASLNTLISFFSDVNQRCYDEIYRIDDYGQLQYVVDEDLDYIKEYLIEDLEEKNYIITLSKGSNEMWTWLEIQAQDSRYYSNPYKAERYDLGNPWLDNVESLMEEGLTEEEANKEAEEIEEMIIYDHFLPEYLEKNNIHPEKCEIRVLY